MQRKSRPALAHSFIWKVRAKMENKTHISSTACTLFLPKVTKNFVERASVDAL